MARSLQGHISLATVCMSLRELTYTVRRMVRRRYDMWIVKRKHVRDEDGGPAALEFKDEEGLMRANVRWDGSMQVWLDMQTEEQTTRHDTFHTSDLRALIQKLKELQTACEELFARGYWAEEIHPHTSDDLAYVPDETVRGGATPPP